MTWTREAQRYSVWFTRDERRDRAIGVGPAVYEHQGSGAADAWRPRFVAPRDPQGGGTWIGANELGLTVALGNKNSDLPPPPRAVSRGLVVWDLLSRPDIEAAETALIDEAPFERLRPFTIVLVFPGEAARLLHWDGRELSGESRSASGLLLATSSLGAEAETARSAHVQAVAGGTFDDATLESLHRNPEGGRLGTVCVDRPEVASVSLANVRVDDEEVVMTYTPGWPATTAADAPIVVPRARASGFAPGSPTESPPR